VNYFDNKITTFTFISQFLTFYLGPIGLDGARGLPVSILFFISKNVCTIQSLSFQTTYSNSDLLTLVQRF
jgi:hypothetical protein